MDNSEEEMLMFSICSAWVAAWAIPVKLVAISSVNIVKFPIIVLVASVAICSIIVVAVVVDVDVEASTGPLVLLIVSMFSARSSLLYSSSEDTVSFKGLNSSVRLWLARE